MYNRCVHTDSKTLIAAKMIRQTTNARNWNAFVHVQAYQNKCVCVRKCPFIKEAIYFISYRKFSVIVMKSQIHLQFYLSYNACQSKNKKPKKNLNKPASFQWDFIRK